MIPAACELTYSDASPTPFRSEAALALGLIVGALTLGEAGATSVAAAQARPGVRLDWVRDRGAEDCPDHDALQARVRALLDRDPFHPPHAFSIEGVITRSDESEIAARLLLRSEDGALLGLRTLHTREACAELVPAIELAISLAIDELLPGGEDGEEAPSDENEPLPLSDAPPSLPAPVAPSPALSASEPPLASEEAASLGSSSTLASRLALQAPLALGILPPPALGVGLAGGIDFAPWVIDLAVQYFPQVGWIQNGARYAFTYLGITAAIGLEHPFGSGFEIAGSAGMEIGAIEAVAYDLVSSAPSAEPTVAPFAMLAGRVHIVPELGVEIGARAVLPLIPHRYSARGTERIIYQQEAIGLVAWAALFVDFASSP